MKEKLCIQRGQVKGTDCFIPVYKSDLEFLQKCSYNKPILCSSKRPRNPEHHKLVFAIAKCILASLPEGHFLENQLPYDIIKAIMLDNGLVVYKMNLDGTPRIEPKSIAFESMSQDEFNKVSDMIFATGAKVLKIEEEELRKNYIEYL